MIKNSSIRNKIFFSFGILLVSSMSLMGFYTYTQILETSNQKVLESISGIIAQSENEIRYKFKDVERDLKHFQFNIIVNDILDNYDYKPRIDQYKDSETLKKLVNSIEGYGDNYLINIYFDKSKLFLTDNEKYFSSYSTLQIHDIQLSRSDYLPLWQLTNANMIGTKKYFTCFGRILNIGDRNSELGIVTFHIDENKIRSIVDRINLLGNQNAYLIDQNGYIASNETEWNIGSYLLNEKEMEIIQRKGSGNMIHKTDNKQQYLRIYKKIEGYPFYIISDVSMDYIKDKSSEVIKNTVLITSVILMISFLIAYFISKGIFKRIKYLMNFMKTIDINNFEKGIPEKYKDEIGILIKSFNKMLWRIKSLMQDVNVANLEKKEAEIRLLQAQINPHFLYNTLNTVNWLAMRRNDEDISFIVKNLSDYLRVGLNKGEDLITIEKELHHVSFYFNIQKYRFEDKINLLISIPENMLNLKIACLTLQPLVENAIVHGILPEDDRIGTIKITGYISDESLIIEVSDNGIGMDIDTLDKVKKGLYYDVTEETGYGLRNIHQRLKIKYGTDYGLNILSEKGKGTSCIVVIPYNKL